MHNFKFLIIRLKRKMYPNRSVMNKVTLSFTTIYLLFLIVGCKPSTDNKDIETYEKYFPLAVGKFISYRVDSTIINATGTGFVISSHIIKDSVEEKYIDLANNTAFRIVRYILNGSQWRPTHTFSVSISNNKIEFTEDNRKIIKLVNPINNSISWKGNSFINYSPFFTNSDYKDWLYNYANIGQSFSTNNKNFNNTITVVSYDSTNNKPFYNKGYYSYAKGYEVYAKDVGKIYQDITNWEYQVNTRVGNCKRIRCVNLICDTTNIDCNLTNCDSIRRLQGNTVKCDTSITSFSYAGYGVKISLLNHN